MTFNNPHTPMYAFQEYDTPISLPPNDLDTPGGDDNDDPVYGRMVGKKDNIRLRVRGSLFSLWAGPKLIKTWRVARFV